jgi:tetratricopeptide (TPR) repeat protein
MYRDLGAGYLEARAWLCIGDLYYRFGLLKEAEDCSERASSIGRRLEQHPHLQAESKLLQGQLALSRGDAFAAVTALEEALDLAPGENWKCFLRFLIGRSLLLEGHREEARHWLRDLLESTPEFRVPPAYFHVVNPARILSFLEECFDGREDFLASCRDVNLPRTLDGGARALRCLQPARIADHGLCLARDDFNGSPAPGWRWRDPRDVCSHRCEGGLVIHAPVGRGLQDVNLDAPRLVRTASGNVAVQVSCTAGSRDTPSAGGLVMWKDEDNYLRLDRGSMAESNVLFSGCILKSDAVFGRGGLYAARAYLRLERSGSTVRALCSGDGREWSAVGEAEFTVEDPLDVGLFADGAVHPEVYPRSYGSGSTVRFAAFELSE